MRQAQQMLKTLDFMMEMQPDSIKVGLAKGRSANLHVRGQCAHLQWALSRAGDRPNSRYSSFFPVWLSACTGKAAWTGPCWPVWRPAALHASGDRGRAVLCLVTGNPCRHKGSL